MLFGFKSQFELFAKVKKGFMPHYELWSTGFEFLTKKREWNATSLSDINASAVDMLIKQSIRALSRMQKQFDEKALAMRVLNNLTKEVKDLNEWLPTLEVLCNPGLKQRHWREI